MEARIAKVESDVGHMISDSREVKGDLRSLIYAGVAAVVLILGVFWAGYILLDRKIAGIEIDLGSKIDAMHGDIANLRANVARLTAQNRDIIGKLSELTQATAGTPRPGRGNP
ncbi:MAG: hypothetical protein M3120_11665 [Pseudomonadota bacterium]|nr:hypothetical protein [Pseudomonadota bacterium]